MNAAVRETDIFVQKYFIEGVDYFKITPSVFRTAFGGMDERQQNEVTLITESGYLMLVKSFTDEA